MHHGGPKLTIGAILAAALFLVALVFRRALWNALDALLTRIDDVLEHRRGRGKGDGPLAAVLLTPALGLLAVFAFMPLLWSVYMSLFSSPDRGASFVGLSHYSRALTSADFWHAVRITAYYALATIPAALALSFLAASFLFRIVRGRGVLRTLYFLPYVTSVVAAATVWRAMLNPNVGLVNTLLDTVGLRPDRGPMWLLEPRGVLSFLTGGLIPESVGPSVALSCVVVFDIWHSSGFLIVVLLAGLSTVPRELEEAARIDGATWWQTQRRVVLPLLSPTLFFLIVVSLVRAFQAFSSFFALAGFKGRGPAGSTENLMVYLYNTFYEYGEYSYGAAVATLLSALLVLITLFQWRYLGRKVHYE